MSSQRGADGVVLVWRRPVSVQHGGMWEVQPVSVGYLEPSEAVQST